VEGLGADEARLALRVVRARLDRDRDGLFVFFVCIILFCVAAAVYSFTDLLVAAAPVVMLASFVTISCMAPNASRRGVGQWGGAGGAFCEDHFALAGSVRVGAAAVSVRNPFCCFCFFPRSTAISVSFGSLMVPRDQWDTYWGPKKLILDVAVLTIPPWRPRR
jgi:hypothetical protein